MQRCIWTVESWSSCSLSAISPCTHHQRIRLTDDLETWDLFRGIQQHFSNSVRLLSVKWQQKRPHTVANLSSLHLSVSTQNPLLMLGHGKWSFVSRDKINTMRLHWPVTHSELQGSCILRVAHKLKYASIRCSSFTIKAQNGTSQMTIHKQFVNTHTSTCTQMLHDLSLKQAAKRICKQAPPPVKITLFVLFQVFLTA